MVVNGPSSMSVRFGCRNPGAWHLASITWIRTVAILAFFLLGNAAAHARMALIVGEPFGTFGKMMPQGHASVYLEDLCVETAVHLRPCHRGELGAVVSRYHDLRHPERDWLAFSLPVFLYGTEDLNQVPTSMTAAREADLRERYRQANLTAYLPDRLNKYGDLTPPPYGDWEEGIGASFDRRLFLYSFDTTPTQDEAILHWLNDTPNRRAYTLGRHNCADFAADLLRLALPPQTFRRNVLADFDMTTPKTLAREVDTYGRNHPDLHLRIAEVPQIPGALPRSRPIRGAAESLITNRLYFTVVLVLQPELMLTDWIIYEKRGKYPLGYDASIVAPTTWKASSSSDAIASNPTAFDQPPRPSGSPTSASTQSQP